MRSFENFNEGYNYNILFKTFIKILIRLTYSLDRKIQERVTFNYGLNIMYKNEVLYLSMTLKLF